MKRIITTVAVLALVAMSSQAAVVIWNGSTSTDWNTGANWNGGLVPDGTIDSHALLQGTPPVWPTVSATVPNLNVLGIGWDAGGALGVLNVVGGGVAAGNFIIGYNALGNLNVSGGVATGTGALSIGFGTGTGTANLTGTGILHSWAVPSWTAGSVVNVSDSAAFIVNGDQTAQTWVVAGLIAAPGAGQSIQTTYNSGLNRTEFTAIPEPATLGLVALMGGGMLWIRRFRN